MACPTEFTERLAAGPDCWAAGEWGVVVAAAGVATPVALALVPPVRRAAVSGLRRLFARRPPPDLQRSVVPRGGVLGREQEVDAIAWKLADPPEPGRPAAVALVGQGGVGKTTLAGEFARRHADAYGGVARVVAPDAEAGLARLAHRVGTDLPPDAPARTLADDALRRLVAQPRRWLLIFDNAESVGQVDRWLPERGDLHVLVTTREAGWPDTHYREIGRASCRERVSFTV